MKQQQGEVEFVVHLVSENRRVLKITQDQHSFTFCLRGCKAKGRPDEVRRSNPNAEGVALFAMTHTHRLISFKSFVWDMYVIIEPPLS